MTETQYLIATAAFTYFGSARIKLLYSYFKSAKKIWHSPNSALIKLGLAQKKVTEFDNFRKNFDTSAYFKKLSNNHIKVVTFLDKKFPKSLKEIESPPVLIYYKGSLKGLETSSVAIVGSRKMTSYGREVTEKFSGGLSSFAVTIISGLARGVDTVAHKSCLSAGGVTIAVLGSGLDSIYPPENEKLADEIVKNGGAVISEYPLGYPALAVNFAVRNRIVSGLSTCVLVVEGAKASGTLLTASHAANQGKTVFAVPGQITSPLSEAPLYLLQNGARIATGVEDVLQELDVELKVDRKRMQKLAPDSPEEEEFCKLLENEPLFIDELVRISGGKTSDVSARLTIMEMKGLVKNIGGGKYKRI